MMQEISSQIGADDQILHPGSRKLFRHWETKRAEQPCPTREDFDTNPVREIMPDMVVIDRDYLRNSFRFRLAGTRVCEAFRRNLTGLDVLSGWDAFEADVISKHLLTVINQKQPAIIRMRLTTDRGQVIAAELLALPVLMRGSHRVQIMGGLFAFCETHKLGHSSIVSRELVSGRVIWTEHEQISQTSLEYSTPDRQGAPKLTVIAGGKR